MLFRRAVKHQPVPTIPAGQRVYAIGDVHGRIDLLDALLARIDADDSARVAARTTLVFLGDLVDRGPDSAAVVARVIERVATGRARLIKGNHEEALVDAASGDAQAARTLLGVGGLATLTSYGIDAAAAAAGSYADLAALLQARIPREHVRFLDRAEDRIRIGDYLFVHAGIRPGVPIDRQAARDLRWIRSDFLDSQADHGVMVVHGHTISNGVDVQPNRIGIDTGAYRSGVLTAIGLEGAHRWFLATASD